MHYSHREITQILETDGQEMARLFVAARVARDETIGDAVYLRALIEYSNYCAKNCLYCGIRRESNIIRYTLTPEEVIATARTAYENGYSSVVIQSGENTTGAFIKNIDSIIKGIRKFSSDRIGITLSLGEQSYETYARWFDAGAERYLLRVESSDPRIYSRIHPADGDHNYEKRIEAISDLRKCGYQVGTGVMIGLPGQTAEDLARDLIFMQDVDIDMCGMGPWLEAERTPTQWYAGLPVIPERERLELSLKMIAVLRLMMPDINIAASTALQAIDPRGRTLALDAGANVIMPNMTPASSKIHYNLYNNKPRELDPGVMERNVIFGERGDSARFRKRIEEGPEK